MALKEALPRKLRPRPFPPPLPVAPPSSSRLPPLEPGDRLTRPEFERRYEAMPQVKKAELIEGVVHMPSPVRYRSHGVPHRRMVAWASAYCDATPGVDGSDNSTVRMDMDNELQPDVFLRIEPEAGGRSRVSEDDYIEGPPELIVEIAASSVSYDMHDKLEAYRRNGVQEYLVWQVGDGRIDWFELFEGRYRPLPPDEGGLIRSRVFPGLALAVAALLAGDIAAVRAELQAGLATDEHTAFVRRLAEAG